MTVSRYQQYLLKIHVPELEEIKKWFRPDINVLRQPEILKAMSLDILTLPTFLEILSNVDPETQAWEAVESEMRAKFQAVCQQHGPRFDHLAKLNILAGKEIELITYTRYKRGDEPIVELQVNNLVKPKSAEKPKKGGRKPKQLTFEQEQLNKQIKELTDQLFTFFSEVRRTPLPNAKYMGQRKIIESLIKQYSYETMVAAFNFFTKDPFWIPKMKDVYTIVNNMGEFLQKKPMANGIYPINEYGKLTFDADKQLYPGLNLCVAYDSLDLESKRHRMSALGLSDEHGNPYVDRMDSPDLKRFVLEYCERIPVYKIRWEEAYKAASGELANAPI